MTSVSYRSADRAVESGFRTVAALARERAADTPGVVAMRAKERGIWQEITWTALWDRVLLAAHGLLVLGVQPGDRVSILCRARPDWVIIDLAIVSVRGVTVGLHPADPVAEVKNVLADSTPRIHIVEDQEQADKVMEALGPGRRKIVHLEERGFRNHRHDERFLPFGDLLEMGRRHREHHPTAVTDVMAGARPDDVMTLAYTPGTTGRPKAAMLTNANAEFSIRTLLLAPGRLPGGSLPTRRDQIFASVPPCHIADRIFSAWTSVASGAVLNFAESVDTVASDLREVQPTLVYAVPRVWEDVHAGILARSRDATRLGRACLGVGLRMAGRIGRRRVDNGGRHTVGSRFLHPIAHVLVLRALRERIGMRRVRWAGTGFAPIAAEAVTFFHGLGIDLYGMYGLVESSAVGALDLHGRMKPGTVGEPSPPSALRLDEATGEIQIRHDGLFAGYWNDPGRTAAAFTDDGWLRTGDLGRWVGGSHLEVIGRIEDMIDTPGGAGISPAEVETSLKSSPYIGEAMVIGAGRPHLTALIGIEMDAVADWASRRGLSHTTYRDLAENPRVVALIQDVVDDTNQRSSRAENIRKFRVIPKELDHEDGELTAGREVRRSAMLEAFGDLIESMYGPEE